MRKTKRSELWAGPVHVNKDGLTTAKERLEFGTQQMKWYLDGVKDVEWTLLSENEAEYVYRGDFVWEDGVDVGGFVGA